MEFNVHGHNEKELTHHAIHTEVSDLPASRKLEALESHSSKLFMCPICSMPSYYLAHPDCFNPTSKSIFFIILLLLTIPY